jgi:hypothetical protein
MPSLIRASSLGRIVRKHMARPSDNIVSISHGGLRGGAALIVIGGQCIAHAASKWHIY